MVVEVSAGWVLIDISGHVLRSRGGWLLKNTRDGMVADCEGIGGREVASLGVPCEEASPDECEKPDIGQDARNLGRCVVVGHLRGSLGIGAAGRIVGRGVDRTWGCRGGLEVAWTREGRLPCILARGDVRASTRRGLGVDERRRGCLAGAVTQES